MTEEEYRSLDAFQRLPVYDEGDTRCEAVDRVRDATATYTGVVREASTVGEAHSFLSRGDLDPKGAIRYQGDDGPFIHVYFWLRRTPT